MRFRILLLSGCPEDARRLSQMLESFPLEMDHAEDVRHARTMMEAARYKLILTEARLPDGDWLDVLYAADRVPVIVTDPQADARLWSEVLNRGGYDLLAQPFYEPEVRRIVGNLLDRPLAATAV